MEDYKIRDDFKKKNYGISFIASWLIIKMFFFQNELAATTLLTIRLIERWGEKMPSDCPSSQVFKRSGNQSGVKAASFTPCLFAAFYAVILLSAVTLTLSWGDVTCHEGGNWTSSSIGAWYHEKSFFLLLISINSFKWLFWTTLEIIVILFNFHSNNCKKQNRKQGGKVLQWLGRSLVRIQVGTFLGGLCMFSCMGFL